MEIRRMKETDLDQVSLIEEDIFAQPWGKKDFGDATKNQNNLYLVAEVEGKVIGYCGYWEIAMEGHIYNVAVEKPYRGKGIGFRLLDHLIKTGISLGIEAFTLEVRSSNESAIRLYHRMGFENAGIRKDFYSMPKEDAIIMWLTPIQ